MFRAGTGLLDLACTIMTTLRVECGRCHRAVSAIRLKGVAIRTRTRSGAGRNFILSLAITCASCGCVQQSAVDQSAQIDLAQGSAEAWRAQAQNVTIVRDDWGIPHIRGKTDADAVFGLVYAQAEDDFNRIETNFLLSGSRKRKAKRKSGANRGWR